MPLMLVSHTSNAPMSWSPAYVALTLLATVGLQQGIGAKYGTRDPVSCTQGAGPRGVPSAAQVAQLVRCGQYEKLSTGSSSLYLVENIRVEVGPARPYQHVRDSFTNIDVRQPLYPLRGSFRLYSCYPVQSTGGMIPGPGTRAELGDNHGRSCSYTEHRQATGVCFRDSFGDLHCTLADLSADNSSGPVPPPR